MTAIRKLFLTLASVAVLASGTSAFAQTITQPSPTVIACNAIAVPTVVRVQGKTERIGDIILTCSGGTPTLNAQPVPVANFTIQTSQPNGVTTKETGKNLPDVNGGYPYVESLLAINDPTPTQGAISSTHYTDGTLDNVNVPKAGTSPIPAPCLTSNTGTCDNTGDGHGGGGVDTSYGAGGNYNIFQGYVTADGVTHFDGVPIDAPGTNAQITIRFTNIEIDATNLAGFVDTSTSSLDQNQAVTASVGITGTTQLGYLLISGLAVALPANGIYSGPVTEETSPVCNPNGSFYVDVKEGHAAAFKRRNNAVATVTAGATTPAVPTPQNNWGGSYFTETGYYNPILGGSFGGAPVERTRRSTASPQEHREEPVQTATATDIGLATQGTRILVTYTNIPTNTTMYLPTVAYLYGGNTSDVPPWLYNITPAYNGQAPSGAAVLVTTAADGSDAINPIAPTTTAALGPNVPTQANGGINGAYAISTTGSTTFVAVYEVLWSDPGALETLHIPGGMGYTAGAPTYLNPPTPLTAAASLAPISPTPAGDAPEVGAYTTGDYTYPRFTPGTTAPVQAYYLTGCQCDLLFPYLTDVGGYTSGVAIASTSIDPYGTTGQQGYISLYFYPDASAGMVGGVASPIGTPIVQTTANKVAAGDEFLLVLGDLAEYGVGGVETVDATMPGSALKNFSGYMIAITGFQYCHAFAYITDFTQADGYLALQLDERHLSRDGGPDGVTGVVPPAYVQGESLNN